MRFQILVLYGELDGTLTRVKLQAKWNPADA
jgi:hypothetical protein